MAYFVAYELRRKIKDGQSDPKKSNVILRHRHPVEWAANPPDAAKEFFVTILIWWQEISDDLITREVENWCNVED